jgi:LysM repeat protein
MVKKTIVMLGLLVLFTQASFAKDSRSSGRITVQQYISKWSPVAKTHMLLFRIPASVILAQGILESGYGNSKMAQLANNHFGIKCLGWDGDEYYQTNSEKGCYRKYTETADCYRDHARIISGKERYAFLFRLNIGDYKSWAWGLKKAGYAEDKQYANLLIKTIEDYKLYQYDAVATNGLAVTRTSPKLLAPAESTGVNKTIHPAVRKHSVKAREHMAPMETKIATAIENDQDYANAMIEMDVENQIETAMAFGSEQELVLPRTDVDYIIGSKYDTYCELAQAHNLTLDQILEYNDLDRDQMVRENQIIYTAPKRNSADDYVYTLRKGQSLWEVSQLYGIKLKKLYRLNNLGSGEEMPAGAVVQLR